MIENINIEHYKCFEEFKIEGLDRINIISGKNNVGKTALLEAFLLTQDMLSNYC
ncbi:MAG: AAA family ATPase [Candidatus Thiodubiliella endoseptemdiera]|uniref:AAA family ATPase n=1 Tax=Candidatus Thiodubiliella endoseptemdiera TaxID=2738886 RepID=A0A853F0D3_9GAMM|nr:AAA family ATPase [Candidatus Thiodubiliella endoseptemdiera]